jgi:hypothetical protein
MRKLAALVVLAAGIGFPCLATAADVVDIMCQPVQGVTLGQASFGAPVPPSCVSGSPSCAQCQADLLSQGFTMQVVADPDAVFLTFTSATRK